MTRANMPWGRLRPAPVSDSYGPFVTIGRRRVSHADRTGGVSAGRQDWVVSSGARPWFCNARGVFGAARKVERRVIVDNSL